MVIRIFLSYSHKNKGHLDRLDSHLAPLLREKDVEAWFDGDIEPGKALTPEIRKALRGTDIFVALGSADYLRSDYCYRKEYQPMLRKAKQGRVRVVVALVGICDWPNTEMAAYKMLPDDARSVEEHGLRNRAYNEIVQGIRRIVRAVRQEKGKAWAESERSAAQKPKSNLTEKGGGQPKSSRTKDNRPKTSPKSPTGKSAQPLRQVVRPTGKTPGRNPSSPAKRRKSTIAPVKPRNRKP